MTARRRLAALGVAAVVACGMLGASGPAAATPDPGAVPAPTQHPVTRVCSDPAPGEATCFAERRTDTDARPSATAVTPRGYGPADLASAYALPSGGAGATVAIVDPYDDPSVERDLATYRATYGQPALAAGQFRKVNQRGAVSPLPGVDRGWAQEIALDVQMVSAVCPSCRILLVEADSPSFAALGAAVDTAVRLGAHYVSLSFGGDESAARVSEAVHYDHPGVAITAATGDDGFAAGTTFPSTLPTVTAVGGTSLQRAPGTGRGWTERAWSGAGSGCSGYIPQPSFQVGVGTACGRRGVADVSAVADPDTGVAVLVSYSGEGWSVFGGTSASTPIIAGVYALAGNPGPTPAAVPYDHTGQLHDVTAGANGTCSPARLCTAAPGWDGPTGLGTPDGVGAFSATDPGCGGTAASAGGTAAGVAGRYVALAPRRVLDTRGARAPLTQGTTRVVPLAGVLPAAASAAVVNLTVVNPGASGYVTAFPAGTARPVASSVNVRHGVTRANSVTVALGTGAADRQLAVFDSAGTTDLVVDLLGFYTAAGAGTVGAEYVPLGTGVRLADTRAGAPLRAQGTRSRLCVRTSFADGATTARGVSAVAVNITAVGPTGSGYLKAWNGDAAAEPVVSTVNFAARQTVPNFAVVPVSCLDDACSEVTFAVANRISAATQVVVDVVGFYAAPGLPGGTAYAPAPPRRVVDTRSALGFGPLGPGATGSATVGPTGAPVAAALNVTAVAPSATTYLTLFPAGGARPVVSNLNPGTGEVVANAAQVDLDDGQRFSVFNAAGRTGVVVDVQGVFAAGTTPADGVWRGVPG